MPEMSSPRLSPERAEVQAFRLEPIPQEEVSLKVLPSLEEDPQQIITILTHVEYKEPETVTPSIYQGKTESAEEDPKPEGEIPLEDHIKDNTKEEGGEHDQDQTEPTEEEEQEGEGRTVVREKSASPPREPSPRAPSPPVPKSVRVLSTIIMKEDQYNPNNLPTDIREDEYYYEWVEEILEEFPNKCPPYTLTRLTNTIYIGSLVNSEDTNHLKRIGITHVLNCAGTRRFDLDKNPYDKSVGVREYLMISAEDFEDYDIVRHFGNAFAFIERCKKQGGKCLIHCNLGVNRSGAICAGYILADEKKTLLQVIIELKKARQVILTNRGFRYQLINYARLRNLLDPIADATGLPVTIPPPTGHSKFSRDSMTRSMKSKGTSDVPPASDFLPAKATSGAHQARKCNECKDEMYIPPRPRSACGTLMDPPVSSRSFTRSSSAMGVYRKPSNHRPYSWSDAEIDDYTNGVNPDDDYDEPSSFTSYASFKPKSSYSWSRSPSKNTRLSVLNEGLSYGGERRSSTYGSSSSGSSGSGSTRRATSYRGSSTMPIMDIQTSSHNIHNNGLGSSNGYLGSTSSYSNPYSTFSTGRVGGFTFNLPKPPFGTSRRRFGPSKGISLNY